MERARHLLETAGAVLKRGDSSSRERWVIRYRERVDGGVRHRSIYVGDELLAKLAKSLIEQWRAEAITPEQIRRTQILQLVDETAKSRGYSERARLRLRKTAKRCIGDRVAALRFVVGLRQDDPDIRDGRRPGRPAKSGLW